MPFHGRHYDVTADGQRFLMIKSVQRPRQMNVVRNWIEELTRLVPVD